MTDKVQKIREEVEKRYEYWKEKESNSHSIESEIRMSECQHLLLMLDSLQEEPVSEEFEDAADNALSNVLNAHEIVNVRSCLEMFKSGAKWKEERIMAKAIDAELYSDGMLTPLIGVKDKEKISNIKFGDKVKLIIIKED